MAGTKRLSFKGDIGPATKRKRKEPREGSVKEEKAVAGPKEEEEGWVTAVAQEDLHGPLMLCYNLDRAVAVSSDANGRVFVTDLECPEGRLSMVEPHEVRQVFVVARLPQDNGALQVTLKSSMGQYMSSDRFGKVQCTSDAVGPAETWELIKRPDGWAFQSANDLFLSIGRSKGATGKEVVRCDAESIGFCETFTVRTQARYRQAPPATKTPTTTGKPRVASKKELEAMAGRTLTMDQVDDLRAAERDGTLHEAILDVRVKGKSDKFG
ncbi:FRG1-like family-domain-containing protein [Protomyces lactucae-debilis]|uniref:FRG1-like family-domain-containing protein n=1 Tax=Protomyces lactucae-debilis TaxID=2754530 RepID=A0A1Y2EZG7_PROLT|nr:FRG1-like family-domain-containing protein [Protomyces lactucae-debilis]ORY76973.1 FRG1-like family-domain-containing protein [Protomyces lactucae-debilis]